MEKDVTILKLLEKLKLNFNFNSIEIVDYWEADLCAIGLRKENRMVYISTFNYYDNVVLSYDFDLEIIDKQKSQIFKIGRNVSEAQLLAEIKLFLGV